MRSKVLCCSAEAKGGVQRDWVQQMETEPHWEDDRMQINQTNKCWAVLGLGANNLIYSQLFGIEDGACCRASGIRK